MSTTKEINELLKYCNGDGLNIGCGWTPIGNSIGIDINEKASAAKMICPADNLSFVNDNSYDYIICAACLEHIDRGPIKVLREWLRCIKIGGTIAVTVPDAEYGMWAMTGDRGIPGQLVKLEPEMEHLHAFTVNSLKLLFEFAGMNVIRCELIDRLPSRVEPVILCVGIKTEAFK